jgi:uncharacterized protein (DUF983 family)
MIGRALRRRCPWCGGREIFQGWFRMAATCPQCGLRFERESGYWVGAVTFNTAFGIAVFLVSLGLSLLLTWPEVPWSWMAPLTGGVAVAAVVLAYPYVKLLWVAYDLRVHPLEPGEPGYGFDRV